MRCLVFNGWAAGLEAWSLCSFDHDWVFDYIEQLDKLPEKVLDDFDEFVLVGFSMGGTSALRMVLRYPEKIRGLVLVSATPRMMELKAENWAGMSERRLNAFQFGTEFMFGDDPSPIYDQVNLARGIEYLRTTDIRHELVEVVSSNPRLLDIPVHIFQSERDGIVRPQNVDFLKRIFPQAKITMVPGTEHVLPITIPDQIDDAVNQILSSSK